MILGPQQSVTLTDLGSLTYQGIQFDSLASNGVDDIKQVKVTSNAAGTQFTLQPYDDVEAGTIYNDFTDTITISQANSPQLGMMLGSVTRTGTGAGGPTKIACITHAESSKGTRVICSGQSPNDDTIPYNVTFIEADETLLTSREFLYQ